MSLFVFVCLCACWIVGWLVRWFVGALDGWCLVSCACVLDYSLIGLFDVLFCPCIRLFTCLLVDVCVWCLVGLLVGWLIG